MEKLCVGKNRFLVTDFQMLSFLKVILEDKYHSLLSTQ